MKPPRNLVELASIIAVAAPARRRVGNDLVMVPWDIVVEIRAELERRGIDWKRAAKAATPRPARFSRVDLKLAQAMLSERGASVRSVAAALGVDEKTIYHHAEAGRLNTYEQRRDRLDLDLAKRLLLEGLPVRTIAHACGVGRSAVYAAIIKGKLPRAHVYKSNSRRVKS